MIILYYKQSCFYPLLSWYFFLLLNIVETRYFYYVPSPSMSKLWIVEFIKVVLDKYYWYNFYLKIQNLQNVKSIQMTSSDIRIDHDLQDP